MCSIVGLAQYRSLTAFLGCNPAVLAPQMPSPMLVCRQMATALVSRFFLLCRALLAQDLTPDGQGPIRTIAALPGCSWVASQMATVPQQPGRLQGKLLL